jgi:CRP-like cAMP-binding protein
MNPPAKQYKNRVLAALPKAEIGRLRPHLSPVNLKLRTQLLDGRADHAYFLEEGLASVVLTLAVGATVEVGVVGIDGVVGLPILLGAETMPGETFIQVEGSGFRIDAKRLKSEFERAGQLRSHLQKYVLANLVQSAQNAACNRLHTISERLARWLLTCHDRVQTDRMPLTHEFLGQMLGAPRTTVTLAAGMLHQAGLLDYSRGHVTIKNRAKNLSTSHANATESCGMNTGVLSCCECLAPDRREMPLYAKLKGNPCSILRGPGASWRVSTFLRSSKPATS